MICFVLVTLYFPFQFRKASNCLPRPFQRTEEKLALYETRIAALENEITNLKQSHLEVSSTCMVKFSFK